MIFERMDAMYGPRPGGGRMRQPGGAPQNSGINPGGMYTGGNQPPQAGLPPMGGPGQQFQGAPPMNLLSGGPMPAQRIPMQTGGQLPPNRLAVMPWWAGMGF